MLSPLQWIVKDEFTGPCSQDQSGSIIGDYFYVHGGLNISRTSDKRATNGLYRIRINPTIGSWDDLTTEDSPSLSQHACVAFENKYLIFIGGWTGRNRIPGVHVYNTESQRWLPPALSEPHLKGFPQGAGLSAHTVTPMQSSALKNDFAAFVIGREGSLRMQRRSGNIYLLYGKLPSDYTKPPSFTYCEANSNLSASSRSYHTSTAISPNTLVTIGGRSDRTVELLSWSRSKQPLSMDWPAELICSKGRCSSVSALMRDIQTNKVQTIKTTPSKQSCFRGHNAIAGENSVLITGGEGFNALVRDPIDTAFMYIYNQTEKKGILHNIGKLQNPRAYAVCGVHEATGTAWLYGGIGPGGKMQNTLLKLESLGNSMDIRGAERR